MQTTSILLRRDLSAFHPGFVALLPPSSQQKLSRKREQNDPTDNTTVKLYSAGVGGRHHLRWPDESPTHKAAP